MKLNKPPFVVGITGHRDIHTDSQEGVKKHLHIFFDWLDGKDELPEQEALGPGLGLINTPIVVLGGMAPGADTLMAEVVAERQKTGRDIFLRAVLAFPDEQLMKEADGFEVALNGDPEKGLSDTQWQAQRNDPVAVKRRRQGVGEYIASYSHLLVAIADENGRATAGSPAGIVHAKLNGPTHGLLPIEPSFTWSDNGPVAHLQVASRVRENPADLAKRVFTLMWPTDVGHEWPEADASKIGIERLRRMCESLEKFNHETYLGPNGSRRHPEPSEAVEIEKMMCERGESISDGRAHLEPLKKIAERLRGAARVRRRAAWISQHRLEPQFNGLMRALIVLVIAGAALLHFYGHWGYPPEHHAKPCKLGDTAAHSAHTQELDHAAHGTGHDTHHASGWKWQPHADAPTLLLGATILIAGLIVVLTSWHRSSGRESKRYDYRALAEGLRVQIYWSLMGLGASVPARFMQRQRGELDWIRNSISGLCHPYEMDQRAFLKLDPEERHQVYKQVNKTWIGSQVDFFSSTAAAYLNRIHFWHQTGHGLVIAALIHLLFMLVHYHCFQKHCYEGFALVGVVFVLLAAGFRALAGRGHHGSTQEHAETKELDERIEKKWPLLWYGDILFSMFGRHGLAATLSASFGLSAVLLAALVVVDQGLQPFPWPPTFHGTRVVMIGVWLLLGALSLAWAEKRLYAEQYRQYATMRAIYRIQYKRVEELLSVRFPPDKNGGISEREQELRDLFIAIGEESLDENAEWLLLHRARPLEPFMPG